MLSIYTNPAFRAHDTGPGHPESIDRLDAALAGVDRAGLASRIEPAAPVHPDTRRIIAKVHSESYDRRFQAACERGDPLFHSIDNPISRGSHHAAVAAVGIALTAADEIWRRNEIERAFVVARPPGHHATREQAMGFCFFNTIACVAEWLLEQESIERILIFDWDVHHGNGTQDLFFDRDDVFYVSTHRYPFYPGTGAASEIGIGRGRGFTKNFPFPAATGDSTYLHRVETEIVPLIAAYQPQVILVSAGFDAHHRDPLGGMRVTESAFGEMTRRMAESANDFGGGRMLTLLEGGYDPEGVASSIAAHVGALAGE